MFNLLPGICDDDIFIYCIYREITKIVAQQHPPPPNDNLYVTCEQFKYWGGRGYHKSVPFGGGDGQKVAPPKDLFDQPRGEMSSTRGKLADSLGDHLVLSPEEVFLMTSPGTESSYPSPPQPLKHSCAKDLAML